MLSSPPSNLQTLISFLYCQTPDIWLETALTNLPLLLLDHAHCERKAAATAINFISKYANKKELVKLMSPLAREELLHFEKVLELMNVHGIKFIPLKPSIYAQKLHSLAVKQDDPQRLSDLLIIGAIIEARSCERFYLLSSILPDENLARFYSTLVKAEARHFEEYLQLARLYSKDISSRLDYFLTVESELIQGREDVFRFHSGIPNDCTISMSSAV